MPHDARWQKAENYHCSGKSNHRKERPGRRGVARHRLGGMFSQFHQLLIGLMFCDAPSRRVPSMRHAPSSTPFPSLLQFVKQFAAKGNAVHATVRGEGGEDLRQLQKAGSVTIGNLDVSDPKSIQARPHLQHPAVGSTTDRLRLTTEAAVSAEVGCGGEHTV